MSSSSGMKRTGPASCDDAIAEYLGICESGEAFDQNQWLARFPAWADELREFIASHNQMESFAGEMRRRRSSAVAASPFGTEIKYVGEYELLEQLGYGGMGIVFKARQASLDRLVALKMLLDDSRDRDRFRVEAETAASLDHPNLVTIYEVGDHDGWPYYTMQFVDGRDLRSYLEEHAIQPLATAALVAKLARAVQYAHDRGVLHRDLKPANVLVDKLGEPHITDFGLAKFVADASQVTDTLTGTVMGTPSYMAPEQAAGDTTQITVGTDVYGLGGILYALLSGRAPFSGASSLAVLRQVERETPTPPRSLRKNVPADLETICLKCLEKLPRDRYRSAEALANDLNRFATGQPIAARPANLVERSWRWCLRNPTIAALSSLLVLILLGSAFGGILMAKREREAHRGAEAARALEAQARADTEKSLVDAFVTNGRLAMQRSRPAEALLWYATAADSAKTEWQKEINNVRVDVRSHRVPLPIRAARFDGQRVSALEFHPDSRYLLVGDASGQCYCWDLVSGQPWIDLSKGVPVTAAHWTADGRWLIVGTERGDVEVIDLSVGTRRSLGKLDGPIQTLASDQSAACLVATSHRQARWFGLQSNEVEAAREIWQPELEGSIVHAVMNGRGDLLAIQTNDDHVHLFSSSSWPEPLFKPFEHAYQEPQVDRPRPNRPQFGRENQLVLYDEHRVQTIDTATGEEIDRFAIGFSRLLLVDAGSDRLLNGGDRRARLWNLDGTDSSSAYSHRGFVMDGDFSSDGKNIAIASWDRHVYVWKTSSRLKSHVLPHQTRVERVRFSPCGNFIATAQTDGLVRVFKIDRSQVYRSRLNVPGDGSRGRVSSDGVWLTAGISTPSAITALQLVSPTSQHPNGPSVDLGGTLIDADVDRHGRFAAAIVASQPSAAAESLAPCDLLLCDLIDGLVTQRKRLAVRAQRVLVCDDRYVTVTDDGVIRLFDQSLDEIGSVDGIGGEHVPAHATPERLLVETSSQGRLLALGRGTRVSVFDTKTALPCRPPFEHGVAVTCVSLSGDERFVASGTEIGEVTIRSVRAPAEIDTHIALPGYVYSIRFSPDAQRIVVAAADGSARLIDVRTGELLGRAMNHENDVFDAMFSLNGKFVYTIGDNGLFAIWDAQNGSMVTQNLFPNKGDPKVRPIDRRLWLSRSPDGHGVLACGKRDSAVVYNTEPYENTVSAVDTAKQRALFELAGNQVVKQATLASLTTEQWLQRWENYCRKFGLPSSSIDAPEIRLP